jgi:hypothetical protein
MDGVDSSRSSAPTSESGTACFLDESDVAHDTTCPGASSITDCSPDYMGNSNSSCSQLKNQISKKNGIRSDIWKYFDVFAGKQYKDYAFCTLCQSEVYYTMTMSTGMLTRHLKKFHRDDFNAIVESQTSKKHKVETVDLSQVSLSKFVIILPSELWCNHCIQKLR